MLDGNDILNKKVLIIKDLIFSMVSLMYLPNIVEQLKIVIGIN
jgi:hypothetical protein